jgi:AAA domain-containing protein
LEELDAIAIDNAPAPRATRDEKIREAKDKDPVVARLRERGLVKQDRRDGGVDIICPFESEHEGERGLTDTTYWPPHTGGYVVGHFNCKHTHCAQRADADFLAALGLAKPQSAPAKANERKAQAGFIPVPEFVKHIEPEHWIVDGVIQRGYLYALTAQTNHAKTALATALALCIGTGLAFAGLAVEQGRVIYLCGENPDDFQKRLAGAIQYMGIEPEACAAVMVLPLAEKLNAIHAEIAEALFIEEVAKTLLELGVLRRENGRLTLVKGAEQISVPDTINDIIMARLDRLGEDGKRTVQLASVIGRQFMVRLLSRWRA